MSCKLHPTLKDKQQFGNHSRRRDRWDCPKQSVLFLVNSFEMLLRFGSQKTTDLWEKDMR
jgi:hypothetical protein